MGFQTIKIWPTKLDAWQVMEIYLSAPCYNVYAAFDTLRLFTLISLSFQVSTLDDYVCSLKLCATFKIFAFGFSKYY